MERGFAPLHAPMGGTGEAKLARDVWTPQNPRQKRIPTTCRGNPLWLPDSRAGMGACPCVIRAKTARQPPSARSATTPF